MALYPKSVEKRRILPDFRRHEEEVVGSLCRLSNRSISPKTQMEQEKRIRREIANSNERRRMQSINAGFQSLRTLLPHHDGEKLSKAAILQQTAEYIYQLEQEKTRLLTQNCQLKRLINQQNHDSDGGSSVDSPLPKRKKIEPDSVDEGIGSMSPPNIVEPGTEDLKREMIELRVQLDRERRLRMVLEEQTRNLEAQLYPERIREITQQVQQHYQHSDEVETEVDFTRIEEIPLNENLSSAESRVSSISEASEDKEMERTNATPSPTPSQSRQQSRVQYPASTSRQNLETIVEAIRHLEGDHLFCDDPSTPVIRETKLGEFTPYKQLSNVDIELNSTSSTTKAVVLCSEVPLRQQVIQMPPIRPGVIVSTHS